MKTIHFQGRDWQIYKQSPTKLVFVPASNPLATWRKKNKLNQRDAAVKLGISQGQVARIESGSRTISEEILRQIN